MSLLSDNLNARREALGFSVPFVHEELNRRGIDVAFSTVAGWFNGNRSERWKMDQLKALCEILQTDLNTMASDEVAIVEGKVPASLARELEGLDQVQQEAILALIRSMKAVRV